MNTKKLEFNNFQSEVLKTCIAHLIPACAHTANRTHRFLVEQWSAASLTVAVSMYLRVTSATS